MGLDEHESNSARASLWELTRSGGCARKAPPLVAQRFAAHSGQTASENFMADLGIFDLDDQRLGMTIDFITPVVPDPVEYGEIAAANALSDVYAAGMVPRFAVAVACVPDGAATDLFAEALSAGCSRLAKLGCPVVGGHSVTDPEPKLGFAILASPNAQGRTLATGGQAGDVLILTKPLGVGIVTSACKAGLADASDLRRAVDTMRGLNDVVLPLLAGPWGGDLHAATDVTGFGLLGHLKELCVRSNVGAEIALADLPVLPGVRNLAESGVCTSAFAANAEYVADEVRPWFDGLSRANQIILTDPQTSGGLLLAVAPQSAEPVLEHVRGTDRSASIVGRMTPPPLTLSLADHRRSP